MDSTAKKIKKLLIDADISQAEIARRAGVDRSAVTHVTAGRVKSPRLRGFIAEALGVPVDSLWPRDEPLRKGRKRQVH